MSAWMADTLIATSALMLLVLAVREPVRRQFGATAAYALWLLPAARMLMPPLTQTVERIVPAPPPGDASPTLASIAPLAPAADPSLVEQAGGWPTLLLLIWATGAILFLALGLIRYRGQRRVALDGAVQLARLGTIRLVRSHAVRGPIAFGILDRVIAVPHDFDQRFDEAQRRLALDHELSHHRSGDIIANHVAFVLLALQWFNPLAWLSHDAFRFDQEAACDCRVLDAAGPGDRAAYGHTIAKAASGRALLFASALDHPRNLHRRLTSMLTNPTPSRRLIGKVVILGALVVAMPLTATWATQYVDVEAPTAPTAPDAPSPATAPRAPLAPLALMPAAAPLPPVPPVTGYTRTSDFDVSFGDADVGFLGEETVSIKGKTKRWSELTSSERAQIRRETAKAKNELDKQMADLPRELAEARREIEHGREEHRRELAEARIDIAKALAELDSNAAHIRAAGQDPERIKEQVRASLRRVAEMDIDKTVRDAMEAVNPERMTATLRTARASLARIEARLDQLDRN